jgi:glycosyltransferase involved in cell wall biosynthesis
LPTPAQLGGDMQPLVTIGIPTYNRADNYLKQTLGSALSQSYRNIEVIVSDNCSVDNTGAVVASFADHRVRYFKQPVNIGAVKNFAFCLKEARGKYFLFLHDDDLIDPDFVETCINAVKGDADIGIIRTGTRTVDSEGKVICEVPNRAVGLSTDAFFRAWFAGKTAPYLCSTLFHTEKLRAIGGLKSKHYHFDDVTAEVQLAAIYGRTDVKEIKASYRYHDLRRGNRRLASAVDVKKWCEDSLILLDLMCQLVSQNKELVRTEGLRFLSGICYSRAAEVKSFLNRLGGYLVVFKMFQYRFLPPPVSRLLVRVPFYQKIQSAKSKMRRLVSGGLI